MSKNQVQQAYNSKTFDALKNSLHRTKFDGYLKRTKEDEALALELYLYNARLSSAFLFPIEITEVTFRIAVESAISKKYGDQWYKNKKFKRILNQRSDETLKLAIRRARKKKNRTQNSVTAELPFNFWTNLMRPEHHNFWKAHAKLAFPNLVNESPKQIQDMASQINRLRNDIAHHHPIFHLNVPSILSKMSRLTALKCKITARWMEQNSKVNDVLRMRPKL